MIPSNSSRWLSAQYAKMAPVGIFVEGLIELSCASPVSMHLVTTVVGLMICCPVPWYERHSCRDQIGDTLLTINPDAGLASLYVSELTLRNLGCAEDAIKETIRRSANLRHGRTEQLVGEFLLSLSDTVSNSLARYSQAVENTGLT
jgi:hypothetical protein